MGLFDIFKAIPAMFGAGQPKVIIDLDAAEVSPGGTVSGRVRMTGKGSKPISVSGVEVSIVDKDYEAVIEESFSLDTVALTAGQEVVVPFTIDVPDELEPSRAIDYDADDADEQEEVSYQVWAKPDLEGASKPADIDLRVV
ncbi:MAG: sporulation protein [Deltaproteobacteria bacterium]|nr:sporulation protein [Deltaproteobacteria bacterium]